VIGGGGAIAFKQFDRLIASFSSYYFLFIGSLGEGSGGVGVR
jgi:hypothetical protein